MLTREQIEEIQRQLPQFPLEDQRNLLRMLRRYEDVDGRANARTSFLAYVQRLWPDFIYGRHHKTMAETFDRIVEGGLKRLIINMPPRHTKSEFASWLLPSYFLGHHPKKKVIQSSNTAELASGFGRKVRNLIQSDATFKELFPGITLARDSTASNHWHTNKEGEYFAIGVNGKVTGKGADLFIIDDPHSEQEAKQAEFKPEIFDDVYEWYTSGPRQRLQPNAAIVIVMTRWSARDLTGRLLAEQKRSPLSDRWEVINFPAILHENTDDPESEEALWPEFWKLQELQATRAALPVTKWQTQYQQNASSDAGAIIKRNQWRRWTRDYAPPCKFVLQSWDTAFTKTDRSNYSACTTWGVFEHNDPDAPKPLDHIILLDAYRDKLEFPQLKAEVMRKRKEFRPDCILVEQKSSGTPLIQELRSQGVPLEATTPTRAEGDKIARANAVAPIFASGYVWAPDRCWADDVIDECAVFPRGELDDYVDTVTQALQRFRQGRFIALPDDELFDERPARRRGGYYS